MLLFFAHFMIYDVKLSFNKFQDLLLSHPCMTSPIKLHLMPHLHKYHHSLSHSYPQGPSSSGLAQCKLLTTVACPPCALAVSFPGRLRWQGEATRAVCHGVILGAETVQLIRWHRLACAGAGRAGAWRGFTACVCASAYVCAFGGELPGVSLARWQVKREAGRERERNERNTGLASSAHLNTHIAGWRTINRVQTSETQLGINVLERGMF